MSTRGDCTVRIGFQDGVYRVHDALNQAAPSGSLLGNGDLLDCDGKSIGQTQVYAVKGVDSAMALVVRSKPASGLYVAEGLTPSSWPEQLRNPVAYVYNRTSERLRILVKASHGNFSHRFALPAGQVEAVQWPDCRAGLVVVAAGGSAGRTEMTRKEVKLCEGDAVEIDRAYVVTLECGVWYRQERPDEC